MSIDYSIIVPAYYEEAMLDETLQLLKDAMTTIELEGEIIVTDNNSTDKTAEIAKNAGARLIFEAINQISRARNAGTTIVLCYLPIRIFHHRCH